jgi:AraC-like DNA-binding protein
MRRCGLDRRRAGVQYCGMLVLCIVACAIASSLCVGNLIKRGKSHANILLAVLMADVAASLGLSAGHYAADPGLTSAPIRVSSLLALGGIMLYLLFLALARTKAGGRRSQYLPFLLLLPAGASDLLAYFLDLRLFDAPAASVLVQALHLGVGALVFLLCVGSIAHVFRPYSPQTMSRAAWAILALSTVAALALLCGFVGIAAGDPRFLAVMDGLMSAAVIAAALLDYRYPEALGVFNRETVKRRYARSLLNGLDVEGLEAGMIEMLRKTSIYRDEGFSLEMLARRMGLSAHQVSELLNDRMGTNFSGFVNAFRIEEAKLLLLSRPEATILEIAMAVGFGNKTSFNEAFKRRTRMTPGRYRDSAGKSGQER